MQATQLLLNPIHRHRRQLSVHLMYAKERLTHAQCVFPPGGKGGLMHWVFFYLMFQLPSHFDYLISLLQSVQLFCPPTTYVWVNKGTRSGRMLLPPPAGRKSELRILVLDYQWELIFLGCALELMSKVYLLTYAMFSFPKSWVGWEGRRA